MVSGGFFWGGGGLLVFLLFFEFLVFWFFGFLGGLLLCGFWCMSVFVRHTVLANGAGEKESLANHTEEMCKGRGEKEGGRRRRGEPNHSPSPTFF